MLSWKEYVKNGTIRKTTINHSKIKALIKMSNNRIEVMSKLKPIDNDNAAIIFTNYYDSLREICEAISISKEYKIYSHEAIALFLKNILEEEAIFSKFNKFRLMRNGVNYYGKTVPLEEATSGVKEIKQLISKLISKYLKEFE